MCIIVVILVTLVRVICSQVPLMLTSNKHVLAFSVEELNGWLLNIYTIIL